MAGAANRLADEIEMGALVPGEDQPVAAEGLMLADILKPGVNLAEMLTDDELTKIGQAVTRDFDIDERSRGRGAGDKGEDGDWLGRYRKWLDMAMQVRQAKMTPWPNASNVKFPLLTVASIQFQARAYPAIVDGSNLVKGRVLGPDPNGEKRARADRIGQHMTWQLLYQMLGWEEDTDRLLLVLPIVGCQFRKSYRDTIANANCSETVSAEDFVINYWAKSLDSAPRFTHVLRYYPHEVMEKVAAGLWLSIRVEQEAEDSEDESALVEFYEQHRMIDLDGDGYPEPYVVTTNKEGEVARIVPCFGPDEVTLMMLDPNGQPVKTAKLSDFIEVGGQDDRIWDMAGEIVKIERRQYFTKYGFIPAPDGSFYDIGFGSLLEDILEPINTALNEMLDAGALANAGGGFLGSGINIKGGNLTVRLGEWKRVDTQGGTLRENIVPFNHPGPSAVLFSLLQFLVDAAKEVTSVQDVMTGEGTANQPATTTLALIEQGHKTMTAIFKRVHRAFGQELRILRRLNRDYLDEEEYFQLNDQAAEPELGPDGEPMPIEPQKVGREDYQDADLDVVPVSDPNTVSDQHKLARAQALMMFNGDLLVNQLEIRRRVLMAIGETDIKALLTVPKAAPDPKVLIEGMKEVRAKLETAAKVRGQDAKAALDAMAAAEIAFSLGLMDDAASLAHAAEELGGTIDDDIAAGGVRGMEGEPPDPGISGPAAPAPSGLEGPMGGGGGLDGNPASSGGGVGPVGGDQL